MERTDDGPGPALGEIEFLARSHNRVRVLDALTDGPLGRYELEDATGVARATLGRILDDFEERGWISEAERTYRHTQLGAYVAREMKTVLERFEPVPDLNEVAQWFPEDGFEFDLASLAGATVVRSSTGNALAPTAHIASRIREADHVRLITYSVLPGVVHECWQGTVEGDLDLESVFDRRAIESFGTDQRTLEEAREILETGTPVYVVSGEVPTTIFVVDDAVLLCLSGGEGAPLAVIETEHDAVLAWAESTIDERRAAGKRVDPSLFTG